MGWEIIYERSRAQVQAGLDARPVRAVEKASGSFAQAPVFIRVFAPSLTMSIISPTLRLVR